MPARLFNEWQAYYNIDPFGEQRADARIAQLTAVVANTHKKKGARSFTIKDFLLKFKRQRKKRWQDLLAIAESVNKAMGGKDERSKDQREWRG